MIPYKIIHLQVITKVWIQGHLVGFCYYMGHLIQDFVMVDLKLYNMFALGKNLKTYKYILTSLSLATWYIFALKETVFCSGVTDNSTEEGKRKRKTR